MLKAINDGAHICTRPTTSYIESRMPSTRNLGACYTVLQGFHHWFSLGLLGVGCAGVKGASTRAKGASKVGFKPICYFLVQREYVIPFVAT
jgi:hypothetical protein